MVRYDILVNRLSLRIHFAWDEKWFLLTSGVFDSGDYNTMTVSWGSMGIMWNKPFVQVVVRPTRYTYKFMEEHNSFTLCAFPENCRDALSLLGSKSGRDGDKIAESGLHVKASRIIEAPSFEEAELIIECRKMYWDDFKPGHFLDSKIVKNYPNHDYHRVYFGEIVHVEGIKSYIE